MSREGDVDRSKRATLRRFAALGAASPLVGIASASESDSDARDAVAGYLATTPGAHFSKVRDDLKLGTGEAQYHLRELEAESVLESRKDGDYRRYYPAGQFSDFEQVALGYLRRETPRRMVVTLLEQGGLPAGDLAQACEVSRSTVSKYGAQLEGAGMLNRDDAYSLERAETQLVLLVRYADSFDQETVELARSAPALLSHRPPDRQ